jgi:hypothetical protein
MEALPAAALAALTVLVVIAIAAYAWSSMGWTAFVARTGDTPAWTPPAGKDVSRLRFRNCKFTVARSDGVTQARDVTTVLDGMAAAYAGAKGALMPAALALVRPLNAFSFTIPGFNDRAAVPDPAAPPWCAGPPAACADGTGCAVGPCMPSGECAICPGAAAATLAGEWRAI